MVTLDTCTERERSANLRPRQTHLHKNHVRHRLDDATVHSRRTQAYKKEDNKLALNYGHKGVTWRRKERG